MNETRAIFDRLDDFPASILASLLHGDTGEELLELTTLASLHFTILGRITAKGGLTFL